MMNEHDGHRKTEDMRLDDAIRDAWSDIRVTDELRASTMAAINAAAKSSYADNGDTIIDITGTSISPSSRSSKRKSHRRRSLIAGLVAAALCLTFIGAGTDILYRSETAYASVSAQQSLISFGINRFGRVIAVKVSYGISSDEVNELGLVGMSYEDAIRTLIASGYLGGSEVDVTIESNDDSQEKSLESASTTSLEAAGCSGTCNGNSYGMGNGGGKAAESTEPNQGGSSSTNGTGNENGTASGSTQGSSSGAGGTGDTDKKAEESTGFEQSGSSNAWQGSKGSGNQTSA